MRRRLDLDDVAEKFWPPEERDVAFQTAFRFLTVTGEATK
jgi:hypothetical protein